MDATYNVYNNTMKDSTYEGILLECGNILTGVNHQNNVIDGATDGIYIFGKENGSCKVGKLTVKNLSGETIHSDNANFVLTEEEVEIKDEENKEGDNKGEAAGSENTGNTGSDNSFDNSSNSESKPAPKPSAPVVVIDPEKAATANPNYENLVFKDEKAILKLDLMRKYFGRNMYIMAHLGNGIGFSIDTEALGMAGEDLRLGSAMKKVADLAADFDSFHVQPVQEKQLSYEIGLHMNIGAEFAGKTAYLFSKNLVTGNYQLNKAMVVNEIGNVALMIKELTDVMILIAK